MSTIIRALALSLILATLVPLPTADAACSSIVQSRSLAGNAATATLESCSDAYSYGTYSSQWGVNATRVEVATAAGYNVLVEDRAYWSEASDPSSGYSYSERLHTYQVRVYDPSYSQPLREAGASASFDQYVYGGSCYENHGAGAYWNALPNGGGASGVQRYGEGQPLACNDGGVYDAFP